MSGRYGDYIRTFSGVAFFPLDPRPEEVFIEDIAHALMNLCRFTGHVKKFYSVGDHSIRASHYASKENALWALLHDASEAYISDLSRSVKHDPRYQPYREDERRLMLVIAERFGLVWPEPEEVHEVDSRLLFTEKRDLMPQSKEPWVGQKDPYPEIIEPLACGRSDLFLARYHDLGGKYF